MCIKQEKIRQLASCLSLKEQQRLSGYVKKDALLRSLFGRLIMRHIALALEIEEPDFLYFSALGKPFLHSAKPVYVSIAHSGNMVTCAVSRYTLTGVDIEVVKDIKLESYYHYFTLEEWQYINNTDAPIMALYRLWTRKEAVMKADGRGLGMESQAFSCLNESVTIDGCTWYIQDVSVGQGYAGAIACLEYKRIMLVNVQEIMPQVFFLGM